MAGRTSYYGNLSTSGLVLNLDAGKKDSYSRFGNIWYDISGNGNNAILNGSTFNLLNNGNITFDGVSNNSTVSNSSTINFTGPFTIVCWVNVVSFPRTFLGIIDKYNGNNATGYAIDIPNGGGGGPTKFRFTVGQGGGSSNYKSVTATSTIMIGHWYHLCCVYDGSFIRIYINGVLEGSTACTSIVSNSENFIMGGDNISTLHSNIRISQLLLYNNTLSSSEILKTYNGPKNRFLVPFEYFVLSGGGGAGGNGGGGGGAGGLLMGSSEVSGNTTLTVTVGSGGSGGVNGNNSSLTGGVSITSTGGGRGTTRDGTYGSVGGSGGGGAGWLSNNSASSGLPGISGQGNYGGSGTDYSLGGSSAGGGGGGYGSVGGAGSFRQGGNGGNGYLLEWNNTGYAGGGAGSGLDYAGFGGRAGSVQLGYGGGGPQNNSGNGRVNSGGGGGSLANGTNTGLAGSGSGGSGVVILKIGGNIKPTTGNPTIINRGNHFLYIFNGSGTITI